MQGPTTFTLPAYHPFLNLFYTLGGVTASGADLTCASLDDVFARCFETASLIGPVNLLACAIVLVYTAFGMLVLSTRPVSRDDWMADLRSR